MAATLADIQKEDGINVTVLYKGELHEPYMELEDGFGYLGVVLYNTKTQKVQCHFCGSWLEKITSSHFDPFINRAVPRYEKSELIAGLRKFVLDEGYMPKIADLRVAIENTLVRGGRQKWWPV